MKKESCSGNMHYKEFLKARYIKFSGGISSKMFVLYFCTLCHDANQGIKSLNAAVDSLLTLPKSSHFESSTTVHSENSAEVKPTVLWKALYIQELTMDRFESINSTAMPDGNFNYNNILDAALKLSQKMYPNEELFPETISPENPEDDNEFSVES